MNSNSDAINLILGKTLAVDVNGVELILSVPSVEDAQRAVDVMATMMTERGHDEDQDLGLLQKSTRRLSVKAIAATVKCPENVAEQLYMVSGGDLGDLATAAREMCGLPSGKTEADGSVLRPTS